MAKKINSLILLALIIVFHQPLSWAEQPQWKVIPTKYPTNNIVVAGYSVLDFGCPTDGTTDCTGAFQKALDKMASAGGGTVFVPEGRYALRGNLIIPSTVTLRGEWQSPEGRKPLQGTLLLAYAGQGNAVGSPFITVSECSGIKDLSIWYPEQKADDIKPYPFCLFQKGGDNATFENLTLVNPYQGIQIGPGSNELHYVHNVYGTPLKVGVQYDTTTDIGRLENVQFSPTYWSKSGLEGAPTSEETLASWLLQNGVGLHMFRSDWEYVSYVRVEGYQCGFKISKGVKGASNAQFYKVELEHCQTGLEIENTNPFGMSFTKCRFASNEAAISVGEEFSAGIILIDCQLSGVPSIDSKGVGKFIMQQTVIEKGDLVFNGGALAMTGCRLTSSDSKIILGNAVTGASLMGNQIAGGPDRIVNNAGADRLKISSEPFKLESVPDYNGNESRTHKPPQTALYVVTDPEWGAKAEVDQDNTESIQKTLNAASANGGGIVLIPGGNFVIRGHLTIPSGVELRGIHEVPHHTKGEGTFLQVYPTDDRPTVVMQARSGLQGLSFNHPEQRIEAVKEFPYLIQGQGEGIYLINVNAANPYRYLDLASYRCDSHYVDYMSGAPMVMGISVGGGSVKGEIRNLQFNTHYWGRAPKSDFFKNAPKGGIGGGSSTELFWTYQKDHLDALLVSDTTDQFLFQNFVYGSLYGIHFTATEGRGPKNCVSHGHGTDGSKVSAYFEKGEPNTSIYMINNEFVSMSSEDKTYIKLGPEFSSTAALFNTLLWGKPDLFTNVESGTLLLQGAHSTRHGQGALAKGGVTRLINVNFDQPGNNLSLPNAQGRAEALGCITAGVFSVNNSPKTEEITPNLTVQYNIEHAGGTETRKNPAPKKKK